MASKKTVDRDTLGYLGSEFQRKLVKCFFEDQKFFSGIAHVVDPNMFTDENLRRITSFMKDRYNFTGVTPTYGEIDIYIRSKVSDAISVRMLIDTLNALKELDMVAMDLIEDTAEQFFKQQNIVKASAGPSTRTTR